jgi:hypothetical protein
MEMVSGDRRDVYVGHQRMAWPIVVIYGEVEILSEGDSQNLLILVAKQSQRNKHKHKHDHEYEPKQKPSKKHRWLYLGPA